MNSSLLRVDWYSFVIGTQISSVIGILTTSTYLGIRINFAREYLYSSVNNGNTVFLYKIKQASNWSRTAPKLLCKIFEKNIVAGAMYIFLEKYFTTEAEESIVKAFACGGIIGLYSCFSYNYYDLLDINIWQVLLCWLASAEVASLFEEFRLLVALNKPDISFHITIPFQSLSFWNGAIIGTLVGSQTIDFFDNLDGVFLDEIQETDSNWTILKKYFRFFRASCYVALKFIAEINERLLTGGIMHCVFEYLIQNATGLELSLLTGVLSACLHGIYLGMTSEYGRAKKAMKISFLITSILRILPWIAANLHKLSLPTSISIEI